MAADIFLKLDDFPGESRDAKHPDEIEVESFSWGVSNHGSLASGSGGGAGKATFQDLHFTTHVHKSSPLLMKACATGEHIKKAVLTVRKAGGNQFDYYKVTLEDILVSSYNAGGASGGDAPADALSLNFAKIEFSYSIQKPDGTLDAPIRAGYDLKEAKSI
jgi:type VI secretion system secreted protein Hcp